MHLHFLVFNEIIKTEIYRKENVKKKKSQIKRIREIKNKKSSINSKNLKKKNCCLSEIFVLLRAHLCRK